MNEKSTSVALEALKIIRDQSNPYESNVCDQARIYRVACEAIAALSSPSSTVMDEKGEREAFERYYRDEYAEAPDYKTMPSAVFGLHAWQARAALTAPAPSAAEPVATQDLPLVITSAPDHIWLDLGFDPEWEGNVHFSNLHGGVTWSEDNATGNGIKYLRADLAAPPAPQPTEAETSAKERCEYCDDTGDVHTPTGEWRGECTICKAEAPTVGRHLIRSVFMQHGFTIKEGQTDLKDYVYEAAEALLAEARLWQAEAPVAEPDHVADGSKLVDEPVAYVHVKLGSVFSKAVWELREQQGMNESDTCKQFVPVYTHPAPSAAEDAKDAPDALLKGLAKAVEELKEDGFWRSCSGCHELNEGHDTGPRSAALGCALGGGCSECGGLGAVWDTADYAAMAKEQQ